MSFDGEAEATAILARLAGLAGGRWFDGMPDGVEILRDSAGRVKPFGVVTIGEPIPTTRDRSLGVTEAGQPHILPISITSVGASGPVCRALASAVNVKMIGWNPNPPNSGELRGRGGNHWTVLNANLKPSEFHRIRFLETVINLVPAPDPV